MQKYLDKPGNGGRKTSLYVIWSKNVNVKNTRNAKKLNYMHIRSVFGGQLPVVSRQPPQCPPAATTEVDGETGKIAIMPCRCRRRDAITLC